MGVRITGQPTNCCSGCKTPKVLSNSFVGTTSTLVTFNQFERLVSFSVTAVGTSTILANLVSPSVGTIAKAFTFVYGAILGSYQVNLTVDNPKGGGCKTLITFTTDNTTPNVNPIPN